MRHHSSTYKYFLGFVLMSLSVIVNAQDTLTYENCIAIALDNNYGIRISTLDIEKANNSATAGNVDLLPKVALNGGVSGSVTDVTQEFIGQPENEIRGAQAANENISLDATYNIYSGNTRINNLKKLRIQSQLSELDTKLKIEQTMVMVAEAYYRVAGLQANKNLMQDVVAVSNERLTRAQYKYEYGNTLKIDVLNAEVDLNRDSITLMQVERNYIQAKRDLKVLMAQETNADFAVDINVVFMDDLDRETLKGELQTENTSILLADQRISQSQYDLAIAKGRRAPVINSNLSYSLQSSQSEFSIVSSSFNKGLSGGITLNFDIFDGNKKNIAIQNASVSMDQMEIQKEDQTLTLTRDLENQWSEYTYHMSVLRLQTRNIETNQLNFERSEELFGFGQITSTQYREAQVNFLTARYDYIFSTASAKVTEVKLLQLSGRLVE